MRKVSDKRGAINKDASPLRELYRSLFPDCQVIGCGQPATDLHEIARGGIRFKSIGERCALLHVCRGHHMEFDDYVVWPIARQLALKLIADPSAFDAATVNRLRGRQPEAIGLVEIAKHLTLANRICAN